MHATKNYDIQNAVLWEDGQTLPWIEFERKENHEYISWRWAKSSVDEYMDTFNGEKPSWMIDMVYWDGLTHDLVTNSAVMEFVYNKLAARRLVPAHRPTEGGTGGWKDQRTRD